MTDDSKNNETIAANIYVHSFLASSGEYNRSPHFRPENQQKVRAIIERMIQSMRLEGPTKAIDFGCGTGFLINIMRDLFTEIHGVDITVEMMKQVDLSSGNIFLHQARAEKTPFQDQSFHFATAYSFLDHLYDLPVFLREVYRVLKPGGVFYADLNPNREFIKSLEQIANNTHHQELPELLKKEIAGALNNGDYYEKTFGLDGKLLEKAEPLKSYGKGFCYKELKLLGKEIGFSDCRIEFDWFLGQAKVMHEQCPENLYAIDNHLRLILPMSAPLFKYLRIIFTK